VRLIPDNGDYINIRSGETKTRLSKLRPTQATMVRDTLAYVVKGDRTEPIPASYGATDEKQNYLRCKKRPSPSTQTVDNSRSSSSSRRR
jgi:hypothetical protein